MRRNWARVMGSSGRKVSSGNPLTRLKLLAQSTASSSSEGPGTSLKGCSKVTALSPAMCHSQRVASPRVITPPGTKAVGVPGSSASTQPASAAASRASAYQADSTSSVKGSLAGVAGRSMVRHSQLAPWIRVTPSPGSKRFPPNPVAMTWNRAHSMASRAKWPAGTST